ncbi:hypothetical protein A8C32_06650 [Flavivirga aquatica]|uniref:DinB-like domain-containing protein n=1 Tax=Flavivirga aquatica TaxID=1849968 RepID=A0A1E5SIB7_9FLAO|nr:hypothetical protein [Flavivirga aquatica]OEJ98862.1 hypothetical protein A8C32_06650 [Flavivirga aquatica]
MRNICIVFVAFLFMNLNAQNVTNKELPYYEITECPKTYTAGTVAARMIDGLGFRYFWATEGLRDEDLVYKISESSRTSAETIEHLLGLSKFILGSISKSERNNTELELSFKEKRELTLKNFKKAADILRFTKKVSQFDNKFPFWNIINGPIADALWHCGQIVMLRRGSGNPFNSKVSVFTGKLRE